MHAFLEHIGTTPESSWTYRTRYEPSFAFAWHFHPEYEITVITYGSGTRFAGDWIGDYGPGDVTITGPNLPHAFASAPLSERNEARIIQFRRDFLGPDLFDRPEFRSVGQLLTRAAAGLAYPADATRAAATTITELAGLSGARRTLRLLDLLVQLAALPGGISLASVGYRPSRRAGTERRLEAVLKFLHARHQLPIRLADVAALAHLTPAAFSRFFRRATGRTLTAYVTEVRVGAACRLLRDTDLTVADIAGAAGFGNLSNFNRRFRALKTMSPTAYRAAYSKWAVHHSPVADRP